MKSSRFSFLMLILLLIFMGCNVSVNRTIYIRDGQTVRDSQNTVNGNIIIGKECVVEGDCRTVNGRIEVGSNSQVYDLQTVNGTITVESDVKVEGDLNSVNGSIRCQKGVLVDGEISTVNGSIDLDSTTVKRDVITYNGDITLLKKCLVRGDITVKDSKGKSDHPRRVKIKISGESVVEGDVIVRDEDKEVRVYLSNGGKLNGRVRGAELIQE